MNKEEVAPEEEGIKEPDVAIPAEEGEAVTEAVELTLEEQLEQSQAKAEEYLDGWKRARAEFDNARKRLQRERQESYGRATGDVIAKLLPALDDLDRALDNAPEDVATSSWYEGMELIQRKLMGILEGMNLEKIPSVGEPFDPMVHEAITQEPSEEYESGIITKELQPGYRIGSRVVRASLVIVAA